MGCDIHYSIEKFHESANQWGHVLRDSSSHRAADRNYIRFAALAGVRGDGPDPTGLPENPSLGTRIHIDEEFGHSRSFSELYDFLRLLHRVDELESCKPEFWELATYYFGEDGFQFKCEGSYRIIFWFDS